jgi:uncharacterized protein (DUF1499 family)
MSNETSAWIRWPGYAAGFALVVLGLSVMMVRSGNWQQGLMIYAIACLLSVVLLAFMAVQSLLPRMQGRRLPIFKRALLTLPGAALLLMAMSARDIPPIHDISTDLQDPPIFDSIVSLRGADSNALEIDPEVIAQQQASYPDVDTLETSGSYTESYNRALTTARAMGWDIVREDSNAGFIEAVDTTTIMKFKDDIVIRVRSNAEGSVVDLRSASRVGMSDLGANAKRIRAFTTAFEDAARG